jgi:hypothetical protein
MKTENVGVIDYQGSLTERTVLVEVSFDRLQLAALNLEYSQYYSCTIVLEMAGTILLNLVVVSGYSSLLLDLQLYYSCIFLTC